MKTLIEYDKSQDIEISGSFLFFMVNSDLRTAAALPSLFKSVDALSDEIAHKAETIQYKTNDTQAGLALAPVVNQYMKSGNMVMDGLVKTLILILLMPIIFMIFVGFVINFAN
jgi:CRISPR/Cas system-associated protein Csm6